MCYACHNFSNAKSGGRTILLNLGPLLVMIHLINSLSVFEIEFLVSARYKITNIITILNGYFPTMFKKLMSYELIPGKFEALSSTNERFLTSP